MKNKQVNLKRALVHYASRIIPDKLAINLFASRRGYDKVDFDNPKSFYDKVNWLKINDRNDLYTTLSDKLLAKDYVREMNLDLRIAEVYQVHDKYSQIDFESLPNQFVIKSNFDSGDVSVIRDKETFDRKETSKLYRYFPLRNIYYALKREWSYKNINKKVFVEEFLDTEGDIPDYKFFCFDGKVEFCHVVEDRSTVLKDYIMDKEWKNMNFNFSKRSFIPDVVPTKPKLLNEMIEYASVLSKGMPFVRIDFYEYNNEIYFGEFTYYPWGGFYNIQTNRNLDEVNKYLDNLIDINK
jgi:hypothetical protein